MQSTVCRCSDTILILYAICVIAIYIFFKRGFKYEFRLALRSSDHTVNAGWGFERHRCHLPRWSVTESQPGEHELKLFAFNNLRECTVRFTISAIVFWNMHRLKFCICLPASAARSAGPKLRQGEERHGAKTRRHKEKGHLKTPLTKAFKSNFTDSHLLILIIYRTCPMMTPLWISTLMHPTG